jgi:hypothetical protein
MLLLRVGIYRYTYLHSDDLEKKMMENWWHLARHRRGDMGIFNPSNNGGDGKQ